MYLSRSLLTVGLLASATAYAAPSKEIVQIQRDLALLQEQLRTVQQSTDEKLVRLTTLVEQALQSSTKANTSLAVLESGLRDRLSQQLAAPITGVTTRVDQMSTDLQAVREAVTDTSERIGKLQAQLVEISNTMRTLQAPPAPPPAAGAAGGPSPTASAAPAGLSPTQLYESALKDRSSGNLDLARQGFEEYLKWFASTDLAPNAQFYIGQIHYDKSEFQPAISAFDAVLERFPENNKTSDAMYMKGMALLRSGERTKAAQEFLTVIQKFPNAEVATKARAQRKALGLTVPTTAPTSSRRRR
ncbi:MAG TPA: tetratricopeptide repeat protein [Bryobacteraceae bacterium]|nr:tetratricopeptide repeat protein [Bryobacteraceae bacterium]